MRRGQKVISIVLTVLAILLAFTSCQPDTKKDEPIDGQDKTDVARYVTSFTSSGIIADINAELDDTDIAGLSFIDNSYDSAKGSVEIVVDLYEYKIDTITVSGEVTFRFTASSPSTDDTSFKAEHYSISCSKLSFTEDEETTDIRFNNVAGAFNGTFTVSSYEVTAISADVLNTPTSGTVKIAGKAEANIVDIIDYGELDEDSIAAVAGIYRTVAEAVKASGEAASDVEVAYQEYTITYDYKPTLTDDKVTAWSITIEADGPHAISFDITNASTTVSVTFDTIKYQVQASEITAGASVPGSEYTKETFEWDITVRVAKVLSEDLKYKPNWEDVEKEIKYDESTSTYTVTINKNDMDEYDSDDSEQKSGKWFALLIGTGVDDIKKLKYNGTQLDDSDIADRDAVTGVDDKASEKDEFVLWLDANGTSKSSSETGPESMKKEITLTNTESDDTTTLTIIVNAPPEQVDDGGSGMDDDEEEAVNPGEDPEEQAPIIIIPEPDEEGENEGTGTDSRDKQPIETDPEDGEHGGDFSDPVI